MKNFVFSVAIALLLTTCGRKTDNKVPENLVGLTFFLYPEGYTCKVKRGNKLIEVKEFKRKIHFTNDTVQLRFGCNDVIKGISYDEKKIEFDGACVLRYEGEEYTCHEKEF